MQDFFETHMRYYQRVIVGNKRIPPQIRVQIFDIFVDRRNDMIIDIAKHLSFLDSSDSLTKAEDYLRRVIRGEI